jgi:hypothetical protein
MKGEKIWRGAQYSAGWNGVKLLVLGESSYGDDATSPDTLVRLHIDGKGRRWGRTYTRFLQMLDFPNRRSTNPSGRQELWDRLIFMNFLEVAAGDGPRQAPKGDLWRKALPGFHAVFSEIVPAPDSVLIWGYRLWDALEKECECLEGRGDNTGKLILPGIGTFEAFALKHPSSPGATSPEWALKLSQFLEKQRVVLQTK